MPYVTKILRTLELDNAISAVVNEISDENLNPGLVNYTISTILGRLLYNQDLSYRNINQLIGVLECVKMELYRRIAIPYEDKMIERNGDVFPGAIL
jgi:hypothetical protein